MDQHAHSPLICDHTEAERFLSALDPSAMGFTFQTFDDNADRKSPALTKSFTARYRIVCHDLRT